MPFETQLEEKNQSQDSISRRQLLGWAGGAALAVMAGGALPAQAKQLTRNDITVLNFALNLEYLEAEFYTYAVTGQGIESLGIPTGGRGARGATTGGQKVNFADPILRRVAEELAFDEQQHVKLLRVVLGEQAIAKPAINLNALNMGFANDAEYLVLSRMMEDTGVTAYTGGTDKLSRDLLTTAAGILADEAYHMGNIRLMIAQKNIPTKPVDAKDILPPPSGQKFFAVDSFALAVPRTMQEVLPIVRPFFPNGLNVA
jgi:hypothetical protein